MIKIEKSFIMFLSVSLLYSLLVGGSLPFYTFYTLIFILIFGCIYMIFQKHCINAEVKLSETVLKAGESVECLMIVKCSSYLPAPYVLVKSLSYVQGYSGYEGEILNITSEEDCWIRTNMKFNCRGVYDFGKVDLTLKDVFHIFSVHKIIDCGVKLKVYPKIYDLMRLPLGGKDIYEQAVDIRSSNEDIFTIKDVRKYNEGDSLKKVHWKVSAKHGELFVKNSDNILGEEFTIFLDMNKENLILDNSGEFEEYMVDLCVSMIKFMLQRNVSTRVFINCAIGEVRNIITKENFNSLMDFFLNQISDGEEAFAEFLYRNFYKLQRNNRIGLITGKISESLCRNISRIRNYGYTMTVFYCIDNKNTDKLTYLNNLGVECILIGRMLH